MVVTPRKGSGAYGPIWGDPVTYAPPYKGVYVQPGNREAVDSSGKVAVANATAFFDGPVPINTGDLCEWNDGRYKVIDAQPKRPHGRTMHVEVLLQSTEEAVPE